MSNVETIIANASINREAWLTAAAHCLERDFLKGQNKRLPKVRIACGFPSTRARSAGGRIGECWSPDATKDQVAEIFISPKLDHPLHMIHGDGYGVLPTLLHEILHAVLPKGTGHKAPFAKLAKSVGLSGKPTSTYVEKGDCMDTLAAIAEELGPYPHGGMDLSGGKKQTTRLLKVMCPDCGYTIRVTAKWLDTGVPVCPCGTEMTTDHDHDQRLKPQQTHTMYVFSERFHVRFSKSVRTSQWTVIDYGEEALGMSMPRMVAAESRQDALDMIDAVMEGLYTWDELEGVSDDVEDHVEDDDFNELDDYLAEDEDEDHDYPEDNQPDVWTNPVTGETIVFDYDQVTEMREAAGARTSHRIGQGAEKALD